MSGETPRAPLSTAEQAQAERLLKTLLAERSHFSMPALWEAFGHRIVGDVYTDLLALVFYAHVEGWDEGYFDGRADAREETDEPDYNEGYE